MKIDRPGDYRFYLASDDGSKLYINRRIVVDNDGDHGVLERSGDIKLKAGLALLEVEYFNKSGGTWLDAYYKGPGIPKQIIPADRLFLTKANS